MHLVGFYYKNNVNMLFISEYIRSYIKFIRNHCLHYLDTTENFKLILNSDLLNNALSTANLSSHDKT